MTGMKIALAQINATVGDFAGNTARVLEHYQHACADGADILVTPEMVVTGYPAEDLILRPEFQARAVRELRELAAATKGHKTMLLVGGLWVEREERYNAAFWLKDGTVEHVVRKYALPNHGVFDEQRLFTMGALHEPIGLNGCKTQTFICEDAWQAHGNGQGDVRLLLSLNASPFDLPKWDERMAMARRLTGQYDAPMVYVNMVGGQDELAFDGQSFVMDASGNVTTRLKAFEEDYALVEMNVSPRGVMPKGEADAAPLGVLESCYNATCMALHDYVRKQGFSDVVLGLSGGIDSALVAAIAVDALGAEHVRAVLMPSPYSSSGSITDAKACAEALGINYDVVAIEPAMKAMDAMLAPVFEELDADVTEENIQSRIRGNILMSISNKTGALLLTTGNKSEMAVGYATLYGDMCGAFNPLKDFYKTQVFALARWRNSQGEEVIPEAIITKPPSAELRPDQTDEQSLMPYDQLDWLLEQLIEGQLSAEEILEHPEKPAAIGQSEVEKIIRLLYSAEYKRFQAPPGTKLTRMSFGRDRRYPLTNRFKDI